VKKRKARARARISSGITRATRRPARRHSCAKSHNGSAVDLGPLLPGAQARLLPPRSTLKGTRWPAKTNRVARLPRGLRKSYQVTHAFIRTFNSISFLRNRHVWIFVGRGSLGRGYPLKGRRLVR